LVLKKRKNIKFYRIVSLSASVTGIIILNKVLAGTRIAKKKSDQRF
jgi:hypothetical protein